MMRNEKRNVSDPFGTLDPYSPAGFEERKMGNECSADFCTAIPWVRNSLEDDRVRMKKVITCILALACAALSGVSFAQSVPTYAQLQTFKGQAYVKDENIWMYTKEFAKTFRLPDEWISDKLVGIDAVAFRIQAAELDCGLARRADACRRIERCVTDVYIDETKHPLPWSSDQTADWLPLTDSARWLYRAEDGAPGRPYLPPGVQRPAIHSLMPWLDTKSGKAVMYYEDSAYQEDHGASVQLLGYKRRLSGTLSMLSFDYRCVSRNKKPFTTFRLELRQNGSGTKVLRRYHEFRIPDQFEQRIDTRTDVQRHKDEAQFKQLLNVK
jgi:hypothetical protein